MRTRRQREALFNERWGDLARYNSERGHGVVHTPETDAAMAAKQAVYNEMLRCNLDVSYDPIPAIAPTVGSEARPGATGSADPGRATSEEDGQ
jgi:hypothetical protein